MIIKLGILISKHVHYERMGGKKELGNRNPRDLHTE